MAALWASQGQQIPVDRVAVKEAALKLGWHVRVMHAHDPSAAFNQGRLGLYLAAGRPKRLRCDEPKFALVEAVRLVPARQLQCGAGMSGSAIWRAAIQRGGTGTHMATHGQTEAVLTRRPIGQTGSQRLAFFSAEARAGK